MRHRRPLVALFGLICLLLLAASCDDSSTPTNSATPTTSAATANGQAATTTTSAPAGTAEAASRPQQAALSDFRSVPDSPSAAEREQLPSCDGATFTVAPVDPSLLQEIAPLGNMAPPGHTTRTEQTYLRFPGLQGSATTVYPLYAPADITLLLVRSATGMTMDPEDHSIAFALCQDVYGYFNHVKSLSDELAALVATRECNSYDSGAGPCETQLFDSIPAGTLLEQVGRLQGNFDFGALDMRVTNTFANPDRYQFARTPHIVCPYNYFEADLRDQFFALIPRTQEPRCGTATQDVPGTLQGVWFQPASDRAGLRGPPRLRRG
jgi:hypothetical protein